jgi:hypothetical protein
MRLLRFLPVIAVGALVLAGCGGPKEEEPAPISAEASSKFEAGGQAGASTAPKGGTETQAPQADK